MLFRLFSQIYLRLSGWEIVGEKPDLKKYISIMAPHTSLSDFMMGKMFSSSKRIRTHFLIKKESFWFPLGIILKLLGGIPVDRSNNKHLAQQLVNRFNDSDELVLVIAPEGTRKKVKRWKRGFHYIARAADIPIVFSFVDYKTRKMGIGDILYPTDDYKADLEIIKDFYRGMEGRNPGMFSVGDQENEK